MNVKATLAHVAKVCASRIAKCLWDTPIHIDSIVSDPPKYLVMPIKYFLMTGFMIDDDANS